jgi:flagellar hook-associated protein 3 FlgL|tara:strand:- start:132 stop:1400 length:1269 start_codon:yes stop_codon:yes gene_type:complete
MVISTSGIYQRSIDTFARQTAEINDIQAQASSGKKNLSLSDNLIEIDHLNAAEDHKAQTMQFNENATLVSSGMNEINNVFDQLNNVGTRLLELQAQTGSSFISESERRLLGLEAAGIKKELFQLANQVGTDGDGIFSGLSGKTNPFELSNNGSVTYSGSGANKSLQVSYDRYLRQNFSGDDVFLNLGSDGTKFSVFDAVDNFVESMNFPLGAEKSGNLFSAGNSIELVFPEAGDASKFKFDFAIGGNSYSIDTTVYGNDYSAIKAAINVHTGASGVTATSNSSNKITLTSTAADVKLENYSTNLAQNASKSIGIRKTIGGATDDDYIVPHKLKHSEIGTQFVQVLDQFSKNQQDLSVTAKVAENYIDATQETIVMLSEDISSIEDADLASLLTKLQELLTSKEAAQATFTRITSKSLFDFLG